MASSVIRSTYSVCPVCLERLPAQYVRSDGEVLLQKECKRHGFFSTTIWRGKTSLSAWLGDAPEMKAGENLNCPGACGLCADHRQETCCVLLEVTRRCNLTCTYCFADSQKTSADPALEQVRSWLHQLAVPGQTLVQLSGGEPTVRDDIPQIVVYAKQAGCRYVQLNTNGIRLAKDKEYVKKLAAAGLSFVFLQFDGTNDEINRRLRGASLLELKQQAIENCAAENIGVTLVPTLVPGVNTDNIGDILQYAIAGSPAVRGVHFQPVSYFGRTPAKLDVAERFTLDELLVAIEQQTGGTIAMGDLAPSRCDHPLCGFHGDFMVTPTGLKALSWTRSYSGQDCCCHTSEHISAAKNRAFVARRWERPKQATICWGESAGHDIQDLDYFLRRVKTHGFTVTAMAFQDAGNLDIERLRRCSLHVFNQGKLVPFCANYLSRWESS